MESQALIELNVNSQLQTHAQGEPTMFERPSQFSNKVDGNRGILYRIPLLIRRYPGTISLPITLLIDVYLLFFPHSPLFTSFLNNFIPLFFLWLSFVLAVCGNLRIVWLLFTSGLQGITSFSEDMFTILGGCDYFSAAFLVLVFFMILLYYVLPSEVFYLGFWVIYLVASVRALRVSQKEEDVDGDVDVESQAEPVERKDIDERKQLQQLLDRESWIGSYVCVFLLWSNLVIFSVLQFPPSPDAETPTPTPIPEQDWQLKPPFNIQIPVPQSIHKTLALILIYSVSFGLLGIILALMLQIKSSLYMIRAHAVVDKVEARKRVEICVFGMRLFGVCSGVLVVVSVGMVWAIWLMDAGSI